MATITKLKLSGSTNGRGIKVTGTATGTAVTLHTATNTANELDEVYVWLYNAHTADVKVTIEMGGVTSPDDHNVLTIPFDSGLVLVIPGDIFDGGVLIKAFADTADVIIAYGFVNRINQA